MKPEAFDCECYTDVYVRFDQDYALYDDAYDTYMDEKKDAWDAICHDRVTKRYQALLMQTGLTEDMVAGVTIDDAPDVSYYILGRETNVGYVCFESDYRGWCSKGISGVLCIGCCACLYDDDESYGRGTANNDRNAKGTWIQ